jgi:hypothetical protein
LLIFTKQQSLSNGKTNTITVGIIIDVSSIIYSEFSIFYQHIQKRLFFWNDIPKTLTKNLLKFWRKKPTQQTQSTPRLFFCCLTYVSNRESNLLSIKKISWLTGIATQCVKVWFFFFWKYAFQVHDTIYFIYGMTSYLSIHQKWGKMVSERLNFFKHSGHLKFSGDKITNYFITALK